MGTKTKRQRPDDDEWDLGYTTTSRRDTSYDHHTGLPRTEVYSEIKRTPPLTISNFDDGEDEMRVIRNRGRSPLSTSTLSTSTTTTRKSRSPTPSGRTTTKIQTTKTRPIGDDRYKDIT